MGQFDGVTVNQLNGGLGRRNPSSDGVMLLVVHAAVAATGLAVNTATKLLSLQNAVDKGIDASYDDTNNILAHYHIDEFFRLNPDGTLHVVLADVSFTDVMLKTIIRENSDIRGIGVARNSIVAVIDFSAYIGGYQNLVDELKLEHVFVDAVLVEGNEFSALTAVGDYDDLRLEDARNVSVIGVQDPAIRAIKAAYAGHAAIGSALGMLSVRSVNEQLGSININNKPNYAKGDSTYPLTNNGRGRWLSAVLQNGVAVSGLSGTEKTSLTAKGYVFAGSYAGLAGVYFSSSPTATLLSDDFAYIENNRVWNKAARALRLALLPRVKGNILKDATTGFLRNTEVKDLEQLGKDALTAMEASGEISGSAVYVDPEQNPAEDTPLIVKAQVVANGIIYDIVVDLGLTNSIV
ncbi:MAG: DUF2586 family protein [Flavobacteriaceae bacterium]|nr:DUF2586 family protein [Flavobacteriaceae bacterium]